MHIPSSRFPARLDAFHKCHDASKVAKGLGAPVCLSSTSSSSSSTIVDIPRYQGYHRTDKMSYLNTDPYGRTQSSPQPYPPSRPSFGSDYTAHDPHGQQGSNDYFARHASQSGYGTPTGNVDQHEMSTRPYSSTSHLVSNAQPEPQVYPQPMPIQSPVPYPQGGPSGVAVGQYLDPAQTGYVGNTPTYPPPSPAMYPPHQAAPMTPGFSANPYGRVMSPMGSNWNGGGQRWLETRDRMMRHRVRGGLTAEATRPTPAAS
jgi:hypothetical protein